MDSSVNNRVKGDEGMSEQLYPWKPLSRSEALEVERFGIFDDRPGYRDDLAGGRMVDPTDKQIAAALAARQVPEDVAALVAELDAIWAESQRDAAIIRDAGIMQAIVERLRPLAAALEVSSRTVAPNRKALAQWFVNNTAYPVSGVAALVLANALADADLWQPAPVESSLIEQAAQRFDKIAAEQHAHANRYIEGEFRSHHLRAATEAEEHAAAIRALAPQPAPVIDRDALRQAVEEAVERWADAYPAPQVYDVLTDALLPFIGQSARDVNDGTRALAVEHARRELDHLRPGPDDDVTITAGDLRALIGQPASPRTVTTVEELDALPNNALIRDSQGDHGIVFNGQIRYPESASLTLQYVAKHFLPASVLYVPSEGVES